MTPLVDGDGRAKRRESSPRCAGANQSHWSLASPVVGQYQSVTDYQRSMSASHTALSDFGCPL